MTQSKDTLLLQVDPASPDPAVLAQAAEVLRNGGLVAFPTETVYGLGANAMDETAVQGIYLAKGRPSDNPLIVHVAAVADAEALVLEVSPVARRLMDIFWPGPLTLVMPKSSRVPRTVSAGLQTVAVRMPDHPVALALIQAAGVPVAAPSANLSGKPSPTLACHVVEDLSGRVEAVVDGGGCRVGLESTVLDVTGDIPVILRPGGVTLEMLQAVLPEVMTDPAIVNGSVEGTPRAPGMKYTHYAPSAPVTVLEGSVSAVTAGMKQLVDAYRQQGLTVGVLAEPCVLAQVQADIPIEADGPENLARTLFASLREFDARGAGVILAQGIGHEGVGAAVMNRMVKAAGYNILNAEEEHA